MELKRREATVDNGVVTHINFRFMAYLHESINVTTCRSQWESLVGERLSTACKNLNCATASRQEAVKFLL